MDIVRKYEKTAGLFKCSVFVGSTSSPAAVFVATRDLSVSASFIPHQPQRLSYYDYYSELVAFTYKASTYFSSPHDAEFFASSELRAELF